jgi:hypothetical protein
LYDIPVRWRQYSEPNDPVWWVDLLSPEQFEEGFGSHTPMITGQTHVIRYYPMFERAFAIMKDLMPSQCSLDSDGVNAVRESKSCKDLYNIMCKDFYVCTPCHSTARPGKTMEGTRITVQLAPPEGYEYSIRTPGTPGRWAEYDIEMAHAWELLADAVCRPDRDMEKISDLILAITFYWYNFMPLTRGSAAVGFTTMLGLFLSVDIDITAAIKEGHQPDWEAILRPTPQDFVSTIKPWLYPSRKQRNIDNLPRLSELVATLRCMIEALNYEE